MIVGSATLNWISLPILWLPLHCGWQASQVAASLTFVCLPASLLCSTLMWFFRLFKIVGLLGCQIPEAPNRKETESGQRVASLSAYFACVARSARLLCISLVFSSLVVLQVVWQTHHKLCCTAPSIWLQATFKIVAVSAHSFCVSIMLEHSDLLS